MPPTPSPTVAAAAQAETAIAGASRRPTAERTWQAFGLEAKARVPIAELDLEKARDCITKALLRMEGSEVPLAAWRVHATGAELSNNRMGNSGLAEYHCQLSRATGSQACGSRWGARRAASTDIPVGAAGLQSP